MKRIALLGLVVVAVGCADGGAPDGGNPDGGSDVLSTYTVSGTVSGTGRANATLTLRGTGAARTTTSDTSGAYQFLKVEPGSYTLSASLKGFAYTPPSQVVKVASADVKASPFSSAAAETTYTISGTVKGDVTAGMVLALTRNGAAAGDTLTNASGAFQLEGLAVGSYVLTPSRTGYTFTPPSRTVTLSGTTTVVTGLEFTATIGKYAVSGTVRGDVKEGVALKLVSSAKTLQVTSSDAGVYSVADVTSGTYTLTPSLTGYKFFPASRTVTVADAAIAGQDFSGIAPGWAKREGYTSADRGDMSGDGQFLAFVGLGGMLATSNDYGITWQNKSSAMPTYLKRLAMSNDGKTVAAFGIDGRLYVSRDNGDSWKVKSTGVIASTFDWIGIAMSSDGKYIAAVVKGGHVYVSGDYGEAWQDKSTGPIASNLNWRNIAMSSDGQYMAAVVEGGHVYTSANYGDAWTERSSGAIASNLNWRSIAMSGNGKFLAAIVNPGHVYTSSDFGENWQDRSSGSISGDIAWFSNSISSDGQTIAAAISFESVYVSKDNGVSWQVISSKVVPGGPKEGGDLKLTSDGKFLLAVSYSEGVYTYLFP